MQSADFTCMKHRVQSRAQHGAMAYACRLSIGEVEAGGSKVQGHFQLHREFETNFNYRRPYPV